MTARLSPSQYLWVLSPSTLAAKAAAVLRSIDSGWIAAAPRIAHTCGESPSPVLSRYAARAGLEFVNFSTAASVDSVSAPHNRAQLRDGALLIPSAGGHRLRIA